MCLLSHDCYTGVSRNLHTFFPSFEFFYPIRRIRKKKKIKNNIKDTFFSFLGIGGLCESWEEIEAKLEGNVHWGLWRDACGSEETDGWDGATRQSIQGSISPEKLCKVEL